MSFGKFGVDHCVSLRGSTSTTTFLATAADLGGGSTGCGALGWDLEKDLLNCTSILGGKENRASWEFVASKFWVDGVPLQSNNPIWHNMTLIFPIAPQIGGNPPLEKIHLARRWRGKVVEGDQVICV